MFESHGGYFVLYVVGIIVMIVNIAQCIFCKKGEFFNPPEMELKKDDKTFVKMRLYYGVSQTIMLVLLIVCFVKFKNYPMAIISSVVGNFLPIVIVYLYDSFLNQKEELK